MFRRSKPEKQLSIFSSFGGMLNGKAQKQFDDAQGWHNMFRKEVYSRIDEGEYHVLFSERMGAPNASVRTLVSMMILKEGQGWSDSELFEQCHFNLLVRAALGSFNMDDRMPAESTYYLLRKRIHEYCRDHGVDLIDRTFQAITGGQAIEYQVNGKSIRMDSKLIGSNIAWLTRYELIHQTISYFCQRADRSVLGILSDKEQSDIAAICGEEGEKVVYRSTRDAIQGRLQELGLLMYKLTKIFGPAAGEPYGILCRVFDEQYAVESEMVALRPKEAMSADSIQSPHDPDCTYRRKDEQEVKGYSINITETCDRDSLHLITDAQVENAGTPDNAFVEPAVIGSVSVTGLAPENLHADGAYNDAHNALFCDIAEINLYCNGIQGAPGKYDLIMNDDGLQVTEISTGEIIPCEKSKGKTWRIRVENGYRYFSPEQIASCERRRAAESLPQEVKNIRNNVESSIFQLSFHSRNNKTRYRGLIKHKLWAVCRCLWINFRRIVKWMGKVCPDGINGHPITPFFKFFQTILIVPKEFMNILVQAMGYVRINPGQPIIYSF